jgi:hypothetical protein
MNTVRFGVLTIVRADGETRYVIVDTHTETIEGYELRSKQLALSMAASLVLCNGVIREPSRFERLGLQFPNGDDLRAAWQTYFADTEEGA